MSKAKLRSQYQVLIISERGNELCSGGLLPTEHAALQSVGKTLEMTPNASSWEIIKVSREVVKSGTRVPTNKELATARHR